MARKVVGLDIDHHSIKAVEVVRKGRSKVVTKVGSVPLADGVVVDGKIVNVPEVTESVERLLVKHEISANSAVLGLRNSWLTVKIHRLPHMPKKELNNALEYEVPDLVSFSVNDPRDVAYDYFINWQTEKEIELVLVAAPREHLDPYIKAIKGTSLSLIAIDLPALGWKELLDGDARRAFVEISEEQTTIQVVLNGYFKVLRVVPVGSIHFREGVMEAFGCDQKEAMDLCTKRNLDYLLMDGPGNKRVIRATVQQFVGSVLQTLDFVRAQERATSFGSMLDEIILMGDLADVAGLSSMLEEEVGLPIRPLKQMDNLQVGFDFLRPSRFGCYGSAMATALRGFDK